MSRDEIRQVFTDLYGEGIRFVFLQGGEPLLRKDLVSILHDLVQIGFHITLITNGTRLTASLVQVFNTLAVTLSISLDTLDPIKYEHIRGADQLDHVLAGLELLRSYRHPKFLTCIVSEINRQEVTQMVRFAQERGFLPVVGAYHWDVGLYGKQAPSLLYEREQARAYLRGCLKRMSYHPVICDNTRRTTYPGSVVKPSDLATLDGIALPSMHRVMFPPACHFLRPGISSSLR